MPRTLAPDLSLESTMPLDEAAATLLRGRVKLSTLRAAVRAHPPGRSRADPAG